MYEEEKGDDVPSSGDSPLRTSQAAPTTDETSGRTANGHRPDVPTLEVGPVKLALIVLGLCLGVFLCGIDQTILATAVPRITDEFHSLAGIEWYSAAYLLTLATFQLVYGKLYTLFAVKPVFLGAISTFEIGSIICAAAPNSSALIAGRAIAGVGGAGIFSGSVLILALVTPLSRRGTYTGLIGSAFGFAAIAGPFIGGGLTDRATWRWCFGINPPIGLVVMLIVGFGIHGGARMSSEEDSSMGRYLRSLDLPGTLLVTVAAMCLLLGLEYGGVQYTWDSGRVIALLVLAGVLTAGAAVVQVMSGSPTLPPAVAGSQRVWAAALFGLCVAGAVYVTIIYLPIWFQAVQGASALRSGVMLSPLIVAYVLFSIVGGIVTSAIGYCMPAMIASAVLAAIGAGLMTTFATHAPASRWIGFQVLYGAGVGLGLQQPLLVVQAALPPAHVPVAVALVTLVQNLSGSVFIAVAQSVFQNHLRAELAPLLRGPSSLISQSGATDLPANVAPAQLPQAYDIYTTAVTKTLRIVTVLSCISILGALGIGLASMAAPKQQADTNPGASERQSDTDTHEDARDATPSIDSQAKQEGAI